MMDAIISLHNYFMLNVALIIGYMISRAMLILPVFENKFLQIQRLKFARYSFILSIAAFYIGPVIANFFPSVNDANFKLGPIVKIVSSPFTDSHKVVADQITHCTLFDFP